MKAKGDPVTPDAYLPVWDEAERTPDGRRRRHQTPEEQIAAAKAAFPATGRR
jgi:hypothetical protein